MQSTEIEKECEICGAYFRTDNPMRKYCDRCAVHSTDKKRSARAAVMKSRRRMQEPEPETVEITCSVCGRKVRVVKDHMVTAGDFGSGRVTFCGMACKNRWKEDHSFCACCGKPMKGTGRYNPHNNGRQYCSDECSEKARWEKAREEGRVQSCAFCGTEYIRSKNSKGPFCSRDCYSKAVQDGWKSPEREKKKMLPASVTRNEVCTVCGKRYQRKYTDIKEATKSPYMFCSDECRIKFGKET